MSARLRHTSTARFGPARATTASRSTGLYSVGEIAPESLAAMQEELSDFLALLAREGIAWQDGWTPEQLGHDFWLTRNGHGAGFWDRYYDNGEAEEMGNVLTRLSKPYGESSLYIGDDGALYVS